jgi:S1-C subfamily serine protease
MRITRGLFDDEPAGVDICSRTFMKTVYVWALAILTSASAIAGERAKNPSDAVVFIRLTGSVHAQIEEPAQKRTLDRDRVEIASGTGFVVSPDGYVLTNSHVIAPSDVILDDHFRKVTIALKPSRIEVCFSREVVAAGTAATQCFDGSVAASDPALDLALLSIGGSNLPYLAIGDSDGATPGQPIQALGYPLGSLLSLDAIDGAGGSGSVPELTTTAGTISAVRSTADSERRYLQVSATLNPGNSGGPLIDKDGFALGVIRARVRDAAAIVLAIPINQAKAFVESRGLDQLMPGRALRLGALANLETKGLALRLPEGFVDGSALRSRVEASRGDDVALRIDRVFSPLSLRQLEQQLVGTQAFERLSSVSNESRVSTRAGSPPALLGQETATTGDTGVEARVVYAIVDLGREKLLARYVGNSEQVAFNESVLRTSLASLEGQPLIAGTGATIPRVEWPASPPAERSPLPSFPAGWIVEPSAPSICRGLATPTTTAAAMPPQDFTFVLRAAIWTTSTVAPEDAGTACASRRGSPGSASYASRADWLGVVYSIEGTFVRLDNGRLLQMEVLSTDTKAPVARTVLAEWVKRAATGAP